MTFLDASDRRFHEQSGIRLPNPTFGEQQHKVYDQLAYAIAYGDASPDDWSFEEDSHAFLRNLGGVLAIPRELGKVF